MVFKKGFDTDKYVEEQTKFIKERVSKFDKKLYIEFGGKLLFDHHAARVLPGYKPNTKIKILQSLGDEVEIVLCVSAIDIQKGRIFGSLGINYNDFTLKLIDDLRGYGLYVPTVVINLFSGESVWYKSVISLATVIPKAAPLLDNKSSHRLIIVSKSFFL